MSDDNIIIPQPKRCREISYFIKKNKEKIDILEDQIRILKETQSKLESFTFKEGDLVVCKDGDIGIISGMGLGQEGIATTIEENFIDKFYVIIAFKKGFKQVSPDEIVPYNTATKVLYER